MNPRDVIKLNIPLLLRVMEYSKEEAKSDEDLHKVIERLTKASEGGKTLTMSDYKTIIGEDFMFEGIKKKLQEARGSMSHMQIHDKHLEIANQHSNHAEKLKEKMKGAGFGTTSILSQAAKNHDFAARMHRDAAEAWRGFGNHSTSKQASKNAKMASDRANDFSSFHESYEHDFHEGDTVKAKDSHGGKVGTVKDFGKDGHFVVVKHKDGSSSSYHHTDIKHHEEDDDEDDLHEAVYELDKLKRTKLSDRTPKQQAFIDAHKKKAAPKVNVHIKHEDGKITKHSFKVVGKQTPEEIADGHLKNLQYIHDRFPTVSGSRAKEIHKVEVKESMESPADSYKKNFTERPATNSINDDDHYIYHPETKMTQRLSKRSTPDAIKKHLDAANAHNPGHIAIKGMRLKFRE